MHFQKWELYALCFFLAHPVGLVAVNKCLTQKRNRLKYTCLVTPSLSGRLSSSSNVSKTTETEVVLSDSILPDNSR